MVTFPRPLPDVEFTQANFEVERFMSVSKLGGQLTNIVEYLSPSWKFTATTRRLNYSDGQMVNVWLDSFCGGLYSAMIRSPLYCTPRAHINNRGAEKINGILTAIENQNILTVTNVHAGLTLSQGDFVSVIDNNYFALGQVVDAYHISPDTRKIQIEPKLPTYIKTGAIVRFDRAELKMLLDKSNISRWTWDSPTVSMTFWETKQ